jgi:hypothetical protein
LELPRLAVWEEVIKAMNISQVSNTTGVCVFSYQLGMLQCWQEENRRNGEMEDLLAAINKSLHMPTRERMLDLMIKADSNDKTELFIRLRCHRCAKVKNQVARELQNSKWMRCLQVHCSALYWGIDEQRELEIDKSE